MDGFIPHVFPLAMPKYVKASACKKLAKWYCCKVDASDLACSKFVLIGLPRAEVRAGVEGHGQHQSCP